MNSSELQGIARYTFNPGMVGEFKRLSAQVMEIVRTGGAGTLQYEIYLDADETHCVVLERYENSAALAKHLTLVEHLMPAFLATGDLCGEILGEPSPELRAQLAGTPVGLFTRWTG